MCRSGGGGMLSQTFGKTCLYQMKLEVRATFCRYQPCKLHFSLLTDDLTLICENLFALHIFVVFLFAQRADDDDDDDDHHRRRRQRAELRVLTHQLLFTKSTAYKLHSMILLVLI